LASIGYGIGYPFGVIGVILFVSFLPKFMRVKVADEEHLYNDDIESEYPKMHQKHFIVENENVIGKSLGELNIRFMNKAVVSRIMHQKDVIVADDDIILQKDDIVRAVGTKDALERVKLLLGPETKKEIPMSNQFDVRSILVTNKEVVKKSLGHLHINTQHAAITRVRRAGVNL